MHNEWFYAEGEKQVGPLAFEQLVAVLRRADAPGNVLVWRTGFQDWRPARDVAELAHQILRPPPIRPDTITENSATKSGSIKEQKQKISFWIALVVALVVGAVFSTIIYDNSINGIAYLFGQFLGMGLIISLLSWPWRRSAHTPAIIIVLVAMAISVTNAKQLTEAIAARETKAALKGASDPSQIAKALQQKPSNVLLQLLATVEKAAQETVRLAEKDWASIEPPSLNSELDYAKATRTDIEAYRRDLKTAELNVASAASRYSALLKQERQQVESAARSLKVSDDTARELLIGVDRRHSKVLDFTTKMMAAREELYRALGNSVAFMSEQFGNYQVAANGQVLLPNQSTVQRYNATLEATSIAANRVAELEKEGQKLLQAQKDGWDHFVAGK